MYPHCSELIYRESTVYTQCCEWIHILQNGVSALFRFDTHPANRVSALLLVDTHPAQCVYIESTLYIYTVLGLYTLCSLCIYRGSEGVSALLCVDIRFVLRVDIHFVRCVSTEGQGVYTLLCVDIRLVHCVSTEGPRCIRTALS